MHYAVGLDGRTGSGDQRQEVGKNSDGKVASIHLESLRREEKKEEKEMKKVESLSETEEEARELAREDHSTKQPHGSQPKSSDLCEQYQSTCKPRISGKGKITTQGLAGNKEDESLGQPHRRQKGTQERSKGERQKAVMICEKSEPLKQKHSSTNKPEHKDCKRTNTRGRSRKNEEKADKMYKEFKHCYGVSVNHQAGDLELETSKTKTCIDEIIDSGLSRETKRRSSETLQATSKDLISKVDGLKASSLRHGPNEGTSTINFPDGSYSVKRSENYSRASRGDCFCKTLAKIVTGCQGPQEYVKKLKNCRLTYLNHMQSDLEKLYSLEKYLDSCSLETKASSATLTTGLSPEFKESKTMPDKRAKAKGSGTQSRP